MSYAVPQDIDCNKVFLINHSKIEGRLDPEPYHAERIEAINKIKSTGNYLPLSSVALFKKEITKDIKPGDIYVGLENIISDTGEYFETIEKQSISSAALFEKGDVLFPKLRPYLNKVYYATFNGICSTEFHVLKPIGVNPEFLSIFLRSSLVVNQTKHLMTGNTLPRLQSEDVRGLLIPVPSPSIQKKIVERYTTAYMSMQQKEKDAKSLINSIDSYLINELGITLPDIHDNVNKYYYTSFNAIVGKRIDPKKYSYPIQSLLQSISTSSYETNNLKSFILNSCSGDWGINDDSNVPEGYIRCLTLRAADIDNLFNLDINPQKVKYRLIKHERYEKMGILENDIIIEKSGGSDDQPVGRVAIIDSDLLNSNSIAFSNFLLKITVTGINPAYLYYFLKTMYRIGITDSMQSQTNGIRNLILEEFLSQTIVVPPPEKQAEIVNTIFSLRKQAKSLLEEGKEELTIANAEVEHMLIHPEL